MRIVTSGATRVVILIGPYAIKIAKFFRVRYTAGRIFAILRARRAREKIAEWRREQGGGALSMVCRTAIGGIDHNRREYQRSAAYPDLRLMPTLWTFFYLVNVQQRGEPVPADTLPEHPLLHHVPLGTTAADDILRPQQFCKFNDQTYLVDYGLAGLDDVLAAASNGRAAA